MEQSQLDSNTSGNIVCMTVSQVVNFDWEWAVAAVPREIKEFRHKNLNNKDTYILIFSRGQKAQLEFLLEQKGIKVLFQGKPAINRTPGHVRSENTILVFEWHK